MAGASRSANGRRPKRSDSAAQADTAPGTVTESQPRLGTVVAASPSLRRKYSGVHAAGARPEALRPCSLPCVHTSANASEPRPLLHGSTRVIAAAAAIAASIALPPLCSICRPACAASGCEVATTRRANNGLRTDG